MQNPFTPQGNDAELNLLLDAIRVPFIVEAAAVALASTGLLVLLVGVQNLTLVTWLGALWLVPAALALVGVAGLAVAAKLHRARSWSLAVGLGLATLSTLSSVGFIVLSLSAGMFAPLTLLALAASIVAIVLCAIALKPFGQLMITRRKLRETGLDVDV
jgi:hypothetical protein